MKPSTPFFYGISPWLLACDEADILYEDACTAVEMAEINQYYLTHGYL